MSKTSTRWLKKVLTEPYRTDPFSEYRGDVRKFFDDVMEALHQVGALHDYDLLIDHKTPPIFAPDTLDLDKSMKKFNAANEQMKRCRK